MSAGVFIRSKYESNAGEVYPIRIQEETIIADVNPAPAGEIDQTILARVSGSRRGYGVFARTARLTWTGAAPAGYKPGGVITIPILTQDAYEDIAVGTTVTYLGTAAEFVGKSPERIR
jgi:hypothetical protein